MVLFAQVIYLHNVSKLCNFIFSKPGFPHVALEVVLEPTNFVDQAVLNSEIKSLHYRVQLMHIFYCFYFRLELPCRCWELNPVL